jgi:hypothetical protein
MTHRPIPPAVIIVVGDALGAYYYSHKRLERLFATAGAPGEPPPGNCVYKCQEWLRRASEDPAVDTDRLLGRLLTEFFEEPTREWESDPESKRKQREAVRQVLRDNGLSYQNGQVFGGAVGAPAKTLDALLRARDTPAIEQEFHRAVESADKDPGAAVTAACAVVEAFCKVYLHDEGKPLPTKQDVQHLWQAVRDELGLDPKRIEEADLKSILVGLGAVVSGLGAFRTHAGSAHGRGRNIYRPEPRHARLAVHAAHSLVVFLLETWDARRAKAAARPTA